MESGITDIQIANAIYKWQMPTYNGTMVAKLRVDKAGRVVLPKPLRDELQLAPGDALELESSGDAITLRPVRVTAPLRKERGVWVYRTGEKLAALTTDETIRQIREERARAALDKKR